MMMPHETFFTRLPIHHDEDDDAPSIIPSPSPLEPMFPHFDCSLVLLLANGLRNYEEIIFAIAEFESNSQAGHRNFVIFPHCCLLS